MDYDELPEFQERDEDEAGVSIGTVIVKRETEKAILVMTDQLEDKWIPKSVIHAHSEVWNDTHSGHELIVKAWWAEKEGIE